MNRGDIAQYTKANHLTWMFGHPYEWSKGPDGKLELHRSRSTEILFPWMCEQQYAQYRRMNK